MSPGNLAGSGKSDHLISGNSDHLREESSSDSLPPVARADAPRRREAKEDDRSHGQTSRAGAARRTADAEADRGGDRGVAKQRAADRTRAADRAAGRLAAGVRARRRPT